MGFAKLSSAPRTDQLAVSSLAPYPSTQRLGGFIDFVPVDLVARPSQDLREFVIAHSAESSRIIPPTKTRSFIVALRIPAQSHQFIQQPDQFPLLLWIEAKISAPLHMICANVGMLDGLFPALRQG